MGKTVLERVLGRAVRLSDVTRNTKPSLSPVLRALHAFADSWSLTALCRVEIIIPRGQGGQAAQLPRSHTEHTQSLLALLPPGLHIPGGVQECPAARLLECPREEMQPTQDHRFPLKQRRSPRAPRGRSGRSGAGQSLPGGQLWLAPPGCVF